MTTKATEGPSAKPRKKAAKKARPETTKPAARRKRALPYRIVDMEHVSFWEEKRDLPRFLFPFDYSTDPCSSCGGHCCQTIVHVTMTEVLRIALPLGLALDYVAERIPADGERGVKQTVPIPLDEGEVRLLLRKHAGNYDCVFLHSIGPRSICSVHALRPGVCRVFPYSVDIGERVVSAGGPIPCPTRWLYDEQIEQRVATDVHNWLADIDEEQALIGAWRARPEGSDTSWSAFVRFSIERLAGRYGLDAKELLRPPRRRLGQLAKKP